MTAAATKSFYSDTILVAYCNITKIDLKCNDLSLEFKMF